MFEMGSVALIDGITINTALLVNADYPLPIWAKWLIFDMGNVTLIDGITINAALLVHPNYPFPILVKSVVGVYH